MQVSDLSQLFAYMADLRRRFLARFRDLGWEQVTRNREATYHSMHNILIHMLEVEDSYLHYDIPGKPWEDIHPDVFDSFDKMEAYDREVAEKAEDFFAELEDHDLGREIHVEGWGESFSMEHVLLHTFLDEMAHLGELICLMWQMDEEPPFRSIVRQWTRSHAPSE